MSHQSAVFLLLLHIFRTIAIGIAIAKSANCHETIAIAKELSKILLLILILLRHHPKLLLLLTIFTIAHV